jgi:hypothetical protein
VSLWQNLLKGDLERNIFERGLWRIIFEILKEKHHVKPFSKN